MIKKKETAEQKLLKMIEVSSGIASTSKAEEKVSKKQGLVSIVEKANKLFVVGIIIVLLFFFGEISSGIRLLNKKMAFSLSDNISRNSVSTATLIPVVQRLSFYLSLVKKRDIFEPYQDEIKTPTDIASKNLEIEQKIESLKLVGISWMESVETASVMIEDTESNITYFLNKGEEIGNIIVKTIYADSALLGYENEEIIINYDKSQM